VLARLGHRGGDRDAIIQHLFEATSRVTLQSGGGEPLDGGDYLVEVFDALGTSTDWPPCGGRVWTRLREIAVRKILGRLAREGLLDAVAVGNDGGTTAPEGTDARGKPAAPKGDGRDEMPEIGAAVASAMLRRGADNPSVGFRCLKRDTPMSVIWRWARATCPDVPKERLVALKDRLSRVAYRAEDGHLLGAMMIRALEDELEAACDDERWASAASEFAEAIVALHCVFQRLALL